MKTRQGDPFHTSKPFESGLLTAERDDECGKLAESRDKSERITCERHSDGKKLKKLHENAGRDRRSQSLDRQGIYDEPLRKNTKTLVGTTGFSESGDCVKFLNHISV